ncbi:MBL fold metallo-hydrolase [Pedobacter petrophilus]|uniref:MBL fold metallo-hydrolase n=1 Tax=Pedobacter petrophilus TaxID=1908241 RepID=A0A7K0G497_9SPHI|nr:MBL fold metallo-hydrolase [Pedobacter petrophilus]MRX78531.1 MBL fold metallo-hydrolase [Pedobacter petrophilus]
MNRRTALFKVTGLALIGLTDIKSLLAMPMVSKQNLTNSFHQFKLGDLELLVVTDGHIIMKPVQPNFAPGINKIRVEQELDRNFEPKDNVELSINILVVRFKGRTILIDSGCGENFGKDSGWLVKNLAKAGIQVHQVTDVVVTHAHPDHIGGLTNQDGKLLFPNAMVYLSRIEHDFWLTKAPDFSKSKMKDQQLIKFLTEVAQKNINALGDKLHLFEDGDTILDCVTMQLAPGHTPGHCIAKIFSKGEELYHIADLVHSAVLVVEHPEWGFDGDTDFNLAVASRIKVMDKLAKNRSLVFSYHLPWPGLGHVRDKGKAFEWVEQPMMVPD